MSVAFHKIWQHAPDPRLPSEALDGAISARAFQYCEPFLAANRVGWIISPPTSFSLLWRGDDFIVKFPDMEEWIIVDRLFLPGFAEQWKELAPSRAHNGMPAFLEAFPEMGVLQIWTGYVVTTAPGRSLWIRGGINRRRHSAFDVLEGIIETDWWCGPLLANLQFRRTDEPVEFKTTDDWIQVVDVERSIHILRRGENPEVNVDVSCLSTEFWDAYVQTVARRNSGKPGTYRVLTKRRP